VVDDDAVPPEQQLAGGRRRGLYRAAMSHGSAEDALELETMESKLTGTEAMGRDPGAADSLVQGSPRQPPQRSLW